MHMHEIMSISESDLVAKLKGMSLEELEKHAQEIMEEMGTDNYGAIMGQVMKTVKDGSRPDLSQFELVQHTLREALPNKAYMSDIYARLATIVMLILSAKFKALYNQS